MVTEENMNIAFSLKDTLKTEFVRIDNNLYLKDISSAMNFFTTKSKYNLFLSATMEESFCNEYLMKGTSFHYINKPSLFSKEARKIYVFDQLKMNHYNLTKNTSYINSVLKILEQICKQHPDERGIIFTTSFDYVNLVEQIADPEIKKRLILHKTSGSLAPLLKKHEASTNGIFVSPSIAEGYDFKDDLSRWQVVIKVPYLPVDTPEYKIYGETWYNSQVANKLIQMTGRSIRNKKDYATSYILDGNFNLLKQKFKFPEWWLEGVTHVR